MVDELRKPATIPRGAETRACPNSAHSTPSAQIASLQRLRERILAHLDAIETLARRRIVHGSAAEESVAQERTFELKLAEIEEAERRLSSQAERQRQEWIACLSQLDADRRILALAWERVEQDRIACAGASKPNHGSHPQGKSQESSVPATLPHNSAPVAARSAAASSVANDPVALQVLRQFQTLCSDVRRNASDQCDPA